MSIRRKNISGIQECSYQGPRRNMFCNRNQVVPFGQINAARIIMCNVYKDKLESDCEGL